MLRWITAPAAAPIRSASPELTTVSAAHTVYSTDMMSAIRTATKAEAVVEVRSVERAIDILQCLSQARGPMSVGDLQKAIGLSRPTLYRILQTLVKRDLIVSSGEPLKFALHYGVFRLGAAW